MAIRLSVILTAKPEEVLTDLVYDKDKIAVGRAPENDLLLVDAEGMVSRTHAVFIRQGGAYMIMDFGSRNGTYLNETRMEPSSTAPVKEGDAMRFGPYTVKVESVKADATAAVGKSRVIFNGELKKPGETAEAPALPAAQPESAPLLSIEPAASLEAEPEGEIELKAPETDSAPEPAVKKATAPIAAGTPARKTAPLADTPKKPATRIRDDLPTGKTDNMPAEGVNELVGASYRVMTKLSDHFLGESKFTKPEQMELFGKLIEQTLDVTLDWLVKCLKGRGEFEGQFEAFVTMAFQRTKNPIKQVKNQMEIRRFPLDWRDQPDMDKVKHMLEGAYRDLGEHQMGMVAGVQEAVQAIMRRIDPETLEHQALAQASGIGKFFAKMSLAKRSWRLYTTTYRELLAESTKLFNDVIFPSIRKGYLESHSKDTPKAEAPAAEAVKQS